MCQCAAGKMITIARSVCFIYNACLVLHKLVRVYLLPGVSGLRIWPTDHRILFMDSIGLQLIDQQISRGKRAYAACQNSLSHGCENRFEMISDNVKGVQRHVRDESVTGVPSVPTWLSCSSTPIRNHEST